MTHTDDRSQVLATPQRVLLACGALSTLLYLAMNVFVPMRWDGYSSAGQTISELSAIGAPTRALWVPLGALYAVLTTAFGWGLWTTAGRNRPLRVVGGLMLAYGLSGFAWSFAPMHLRGAAASLTDVMHIVLGCLTSLVYMLALGFGAAALGRRFRIYSLATLAVVIVTGILLGMDGPRVGQNLPTPWIGVWERICIGAAMLWIAVLSVTLLRTRRTIAPLAANDERRPTEKKKVTVFVGSAHKGGATYRASRLFLDGLEALGDVQGELVVLSDYDLGLCRGCKACFLRGEERCPLQDGRDELLAKMMASDGVVFASPNYSFHVSGILKLFFDRLGFVFHRPRFHGKTYSSIVVQGIYGGNRIVKYLDGVGGAWGFNVVKGECVRTLEPMTEQAQAKMAQALAGQSRRFHEQLSRPAYPAPAMVGLIAFRMARTSIRRMLGENNRDFVHYRDHGWFESDYYSPARLGPFQKIIGALFDRIAARMSKPREGTPLCTPDLPPAAQEHPVEDVVQ
ncbi:MAG: NAD(P)H-dependent oxidoreductase [Deltaproteobacteria bacterium]|nr:NAD(P)H-dependent oxidoreductase [Deltaproteobacteria bacterium]